MVKLFFLSCSILFTVPAISGSMNLVFPGHFDLAASIGQAVSKGVKRASEIAAEAHKRGSWLYRFLKRRKSFEQLIQDRKREIAELRKGQREYFFRPDLYSKDSSDEDRARLSELLMSPPTLETPSDESLPVWEQNGNPSGKAIDWSIFKNLQAPVGEGSETGEGQEAKTPSDDPKKEWGGRARRWSGSVSSDLNRKYLINPIVKQFVERLASRRQDLRLGDIGCGNAILSALLREELRTVTDRLQIIAIDCPEMIEVARETHRETPTINLRPGAASRLSAIDDGWLDGAIYNFVLQDCERLKESIQQLFRVSREGGEAIITIPHPAFPYAYRETMPDGTQVYEWKRDYLEEHVQEVFDLLGERYDPPIQVFSRPISVYIQSFIDAGFELVRFIEPRLSDEQKRDLDPVETRQLDTQTPISAVLIVRKRTSVSIDAEKKLNESVGKYKKNYEKGCATP